MRANENVISALTLIPSLWRLSCVRPWTSFMTFFKDIKQIVCIDRLRCRLARLVSFDFWFILSLASLNFSSGLWLGFLLRRNNYYRNMFEKYLPEIWISRSQKWIPDVKSLRNDIFQIISLATFSLFRSRLFYEKEKYST